MRKQAVASKSCMHVVLHRDKRDNRRLQQLFLKEQIGLPSFVCHDHTLIVIVVLVEDVQPVACRALINMKVVGNLFELRSTNFD